jgi:hypothetical protein
VVRPLQWGHPSCTPCAPYERTCGPLIWCGSVKPRPSCQIRATRPVSRQPQPEAAVCPSAAHAELLMVGWRPGPGSGDHDREYALGIAVLTSGHIAVALPADLIAAEAAYGDGGCLASEWSERPSVSAPRVPQADVRGGSTCGRHSAGHALTIRYVSGGGRPRWEELQRQRALREEDHRRRSPAERASAASTDAARRFFALRQPALYDPLRPNGRPARPRDRQRDPRDRNGRADQRRSIASARVPGLTVTSTCRWGEPQKVGPGASQPTSRARPRRRRAEPRRDWALRTR